MQYEEFENIIRKNILKYFPEDQQGEVQILPYRRNNTPTLRGLSFSGEHEVKPILCLNDYYKDYLKCGSEETVLRQIAEDYHKAQEQKFIQDVDFRYETVKDRLFVAACNAEKNKDILKDAPHELNKDLALVYKVRFDDANGGRGSSLVTNDHVNGWGINEQTLKETAWKSMKKEQPPGRGSKGAAGRSDLEKYEKGATSQPDEHQRCY